MIWPLTDLNKKPLNDKANMQITYLVGTLFKNRKCTSIPFTFTLFWVAAVLSNQQLFLAAAKSFSVLYLEAAASW